MHSQIIQETLYSESELALVESQGGPTHIDRRIVNMFAQEIDEMHGLPSHADNILRFGRYGFTIPGIGSGVIIFLDDATSRFSGR